ncbi:hypothetical protein [Promicromonospora sp. NPDC057488]|uniref:rhamnogalacturonan lyase family protein n=1 Tax=Promicromonospora sp. NPDC057488 TaxID=3346147 RepID=UPI003670A40A
MTARRAFAAGALSLVLATATGAPSIAARIEGSAPGSQVGSAPTGQSARPVENLGRGLVAVREGADRVLVSWRLLGLDPSGIGFNVYRSTAGGDEVRVNDEVLTAGTNVVDTDADLSRTTTYRVRPVVDGAEGSPSAPYTLTADHPVEPVHRIPIGQGGPIKFVWVGDLDGDGEYDFVVDRQTSPQSIEAYRSDGTPLWSVDMGPNSVDQDNIEGGSATIDVGHWDGVTVADLDSDGRAEVAVRVANGVTFGDGETFELDDDVHQAVAVLDGRTGAMRATAPVPDDYIEDGPMYARFGVGYLDGVRPHLVAHMKNRVGSEGFNLMIGAWTFDGDRISQEWTWHRGDTDAPDGHNTRIVDVDGDGRDEVAEIGFVLNGDGSLRYSLGPDVVHGDRFHIADMDPDRPGLEGYGVQQRNPSGLLEYYYDAATGELLWEHHGDPGTDVGRGMVGDIDPRHPGMEAWSFSGLYNAPTNELTEPDTNLRPWPHLGLWWDGDPMIELLNDGKIEQWDPENPTPSGSLPRIETISRFGAKNAAGGRNPAMVGDVLGDWREEAIYPGTEDDELVVFATDIPTDLRLPTLAHDPAYRNAMTLKGYLQSHHTSYYLGDGMETPPRQNITYAGSDAQPGAAAGSQRPRAGEGLPHCTGESPITCTFDVPPGHYDVTVLLGSRDEAAETTVLAEARRLMVDATATSAGERVRRSFTVNVRDPEGQQNDHAKPGGDGLTLTFAGPSPKVTGISVRRASPRTTRVALLGDSTVTDQENAPYTGWGQRLPVHFGRGVSVINHSGSGESTVSALADPRMFDALEPQLRRGDVALVQLAHNDKTTTAAEYRANLTEIVTRIRDRGATPVLVTPIVRHRFEGDRLSPTGLIVTDNADLPAEMRGLAADLDVALIDLTAMSKELVEGLGPADSEPLYLVRVNGDRTHTSEHGASVYAGLVAGELERLGLVREQTGRSE